MTITAGDNRRCRLRVSEWGRKLPGSEEKGREEGTVCVVQTTSTLGCLQRRKFLQPGRESAWRLPEDQLHMIGSLSFPKLLHRQVGSEHTLVTRVCKAQSRAVTSQWQIGGLTIECFSSEYLSAS